MDMTFVMQELPGPGRMSGAVRGSRGHAPRAVTLVLHLLQNVYRTEARLRGSRASPKLRVIARNLEARPVIDWLRRTLLCWKNKKRFLPQCLMGKAIEYAFGQWDSLLIYLKDGRVEIDTNLVENAIAPRPSARRTGYLSAKPTPAIAER